MFHQLSQGWRLESAPQGRWQALRLHPPENAFVEVPSLADEIWAVIVRDGNYLIVLDMEYVWLMPSSLMGVLVRIHKRLALAGGTLHLCCLNMHCREALQVCHLDRVLPVYPDRESAAPRH